MEWLHQSFTEVYNEYVLPVVVYGSETWTLKKAHMELLSVEQRKMERIMLDITLRDHKRNTWIRHQTGVNYIIDVIKKGIHGWAGHIARFKDNRWTNKSDRVDTTRMDKMAGKTKNKMERQPYPPPGSCAAKNSQRPASVETVQGGVPPYGVKETQGPRRCL